MKMVEEFDLEGLKDNIDKIISNATSTNDDWKRILNNIKEMKVSVHLAILNEPYLTYMIEGKKTIESRFSMKKIAPYKKVKKGDVLLLKKSSGNIVAICEIGNAWGYTLTPKIVIMIKEQFNKRILAKQSFWDEKKTSSFATLMEINRVEKIDPIKLKKTDRRSWIVLTKRMEQKPLY